MAQPGPVFSATEVLRAGLQAEAEGRFDYAVQFFRHLTDHHPHTPEAVDARAGLQRIAQRRGEITPQAGPKAPQQSAAHAMHGHPATMAGPQVTANGSVAGQRGAAQSAKQPSTSANAAAATEPASLPAPERRYLVGRILAMLFQLIGGLIAVSGVLVLGLGVVLGGDVPMLPWRGSAFLLGPGLVLAGCVLIVWGQLAGAMFDAANAARDLARIGRARAEKRGKR